MRTMPVVGSLRLLALAAFVVSCGFDPQPKSGTVACKPVGAACCPDGYVCVGRGAATAGGPSAGTCWNRKDLPKTAQAATHDYTPTALNDPACLVTDWVPPSVADGDVDGGAIEAGKAQDTSQVDVGGAGGTEGRGDSGADAPWVQDTAPDLPIAAGGTGGSGGSGGNVTGGTVGTDSGSGDARGLDSGTVSATAIDSGDAARDVALDVPIQVLDASVDSPIQTVDVAVDVAGLDVPATPDSPLDESTGDEAEAGGVDAGAARILAGISAEGNSSCALVNGGAQCWGDNTNGRLGDNTDVIRRRKPVQVYGLQAGVTAISVGGLHSCAVVNGRVVCWGSNSDGQLGDNSTTQIRRAPVQVVGVDAGATAVAVGNFHSCAVVNGGAKCWGLGAYAELGDGTLTSRPLPVQVLGLDTGVTAIGAGASHTCALVNGGMRCWGENGHGQLGDGTTTTRTAPVQVAGLESSVTAMAVGRFHTCAVVNGGMRCWGLNADSQLGDGTSVERHVPVQVVGLEANVTAISADTFNSCAVAGGGARCWGDNMFGQLGDGTTSDRSTPVAVVGLESGVAGITVGVSHACACLAEQVQCWGSNSLGQLGNNAFADSYLPVDVMLP